MSVSERRANGGGFVATADTDLRRWRFCLFFALFPPLLFIIHCVDPIEEESGSLWIHQYIIIG